MNKATYDKSHNISLIRRALYCLANTTKNKSRVDNGVFGVEDVRVFKEFVINVEKPITDALITSLSSINNNYSKYLPLDQISIHKVHEEIEEYMHEVDMGNKEGAIEEFGDILSVIYSVNIPKDNNSHLKKLISSLLVRTIKDKYTINNMDEYKEFLDKVSKKLHDKAVEFVMLSNFVKNVSKVSNIDDITELPYKLNTITDKEFIGRVVTFIKNIRNNTLKDSGFYLAVKSLRIMIEAYEKGRGDNGKE